MRINSRVRWRQYECYNLARHEGPPLVALDLGDRQVPQPRLVDLVGFGRGSHEPCQDRLLVPTKHTRDARPIHPNPKPLQGHQPLLLRGTQVEEDGVPGVRNGCRTALTPQDPARSALRHVRRDGAHVASVHQLEERALRLGTWWPPGSGSPPEPVLRSGQVAESLIGGIASLFSKY
jgi:hypothetical protein